MFKKILVMACSLTWAGNTLYSEVQDPAPKILTRALHGIRSAHTPSINQELQTEILEMLAYKKVSQEDQTSIADIDEKHNQRLKEIIQTYGWPGIRLVGIKGSSGMCELIQRQAKDLVFQKECLSLLKIAVEKQDATYLDYAYLLDRVRTNEGLPQIYGTQWSLNDGELRLDPPVEDPENLDRRRSEVGLCTLDEYKEGLKKFYLKDSDIQQ